MTSPESKMFPSGGGQEFQPVIRYKNYEKSPAVIAAQTCTLLELYYQGAIHQPELAKDYFQNYTLFYLKKAEEGTDTLYDRKGAVYRELDLEVKEVSHHAFIVFAHLPDSMTSRFLPMGFSRKGMLRAPRTKDEFLKRVEEIKIGIWQTVEGDIEPRTTLEAYTPLLRTYGFFKVGSKLPIRMLEDEKKKERMEKEKFNDLLDGINVSL